MLDTRNFDHFTQVHAPFPRNLNGHVNQWIKWVPAVVELKTDEHILCKQKDLRGVYTGEATMSRVISRSLIFDVQSINLVFQRHAYTRLNSSVRQGKAQ